MNAAQRKAASRKSTRVPTPPDLTTHEILAALAKAPRAVRGFVSLPVADRLLTDGYVERIRVRTGRRDRRMLAITDAGRAELARRTPYGPGVDGPAVGQGIDAPWLDP